MVAFKQLAGIVFAVIFLGIFAGLYLSYREGSAEAAFERDVKGLAQRIRLLADKDIGAQEFFNINVPAGCELRFEGNAVVAVINGVPKNFAAGISVSGATFAAREVKLTLKRVEGGVMVSG